MDKLKTYVENARAKGYADEQIKSALIKAGWQADRIDAALEPAQPEQPDAVKPLQTDPVDDVNLDNLDIESDKPVETANTPLQAHRRAAPDKPLAKKLLPKLAVVLGLLVGLIIMIHGIKAFGHTRVPHGFVVGKGQIAFSIPGKKGQYDTRVNFKTADGATHSFITPTPAGSNNNSRYVAGDGMKIAYYPPNPDMTGLDLTDRGSPIVGLAEAVAGGLLLGAGIVFLQRQFRRKS